MTRRMPAWVLVLLLDCTVLGLSATGVKIHTAILYLERQSTRSSGIQVVPAACQCLGIAVRLFRASQVNEMVQITALRSPFLSTDRGRR